eukprot:scpid66796/ scgid33803/ Adenylyl cyclase-associated protein 2
MSADRLESIAARLEAAVSRLESCKGGAAGGAAPAEGEPAAFVEAFDEIVSNKVARFLALSKEIGGDVATQAAMVEAAYKAVRAVLVTASKCKQPAANVMQALLKPISEQIGAAQQFREKSRGSTFFNHLSAVSESIPALGWVSITPKPGPYVKEMSDAGQFYTNRVLKEYKEKDQKHVDWVKAYLGAMVDLVAYIKQHHTTGVTWNRQGGEAKADAVAAAPAPAALPPAPKLTAATTSDGGDEKARAGLFAALNQGGGVTSGLKKVSKDQMTHKNPELRGSSVVKAKETTASSTPKATTAAVKKPPVFALQGNKWCVEFQDNNREIVIEETSPRQVIYIYKCTNSTIQVKGKVNNITLDSCKKTAVVFEDVIASLDIINCQSVQAQVTGITPIVNIDKTDGCQVYLSEQCKNAPIITAKSSEMNVMVPKGDGDYVECALPEQYQSKWNGKHFVTEPTEVAA